ncbi:MAG: hypothetical protein K5663_11355 [Clostridiales bacterium]|nr:hypothetical protein [Clostridiales bacterium]
MADTGKIIALIKALGGAGGGGGGGGGGGILLVHNKSTWYLDATFNQIKTAVNAGKMVYYVNESEDGGSTPSMDYNILTEFKEYHGSDSDMYEVYFGNQYFYAGNPDESLVMPD